MNASNVTELDYYTERTNDLVTFNLTVTPTLTLTPVTDSLEVPETSELPSTPTEGEQLPQTTVTDEATSPLGGRSRLSK